MKNFARSVVLALALLLPIATAYATSSLSFEGGGYWLEMEIGHTDRPVVASVSFHAPGDSQGVVLRSNFEVTSFDTRRKDLVLVYKGSDPHVEPFTLVVRGDRATLRIGRAQIDSAFNWFM